MGTTFRRTMMRASICVMAALGVAAQVPAAACEPGLLRTAPTDVHKTHIRKGLGQWQASRADGSKHGGVDLVVDASHSDATAYAVYPVGPGKVAYSQLNGSETTGYGNVVIVDHGNDCYTLYAHLASEPFTPIKAGGNLPRQVGDSVTTTTPLGYFVDIKADVDSTGNARSTAPEARLQLHFELISAPSGRSGPGRVADILGSDGKRLDPTPLLTDLGYRLR